LWKEALRKLFGADFDSGEVGLVYLYRLQNHFLFDIRFGFGNLIVDIGLSGFSG
jgi:hypothetical protein